MTGSGAIKRLEELKSVKKNLALVDVSILDLRGKDCERERMLKRQKSLSAQS